MFTDIFDASLLDEANIAAQQVIEIITESGYLAEEISGQPNRELEAIIKKNSTLGAAVFGRQIGFELGCSPSPSLSYVIPVNSFIKNCYIPVGESLKELTASGKRSASFIQLILVQQKNDTAIDIGDLLKKRSIIGAVPGYMARSLDGETSVKIHRDLIESGFDREHLAVALKNSYATSNDENQICIITGFDCDQLIDRLKPAIIPLIDKISDLRNREIKKIFAECEKTTSCTICDDKPVCDQIKKIL